MFLNGIILERYKMFEYQNTMDFLLAIDHEDKPDVTSREVETHYNNLEKAASWLDTIPPEHWRKMQSHEILWEGPLTTRIIYSGIENYYHYHFRGSVFIDFSTITAYCNDEPIDHDVNRVAENVLFTLGAYRTLKPQLNDENKPEGMLSIEDLDPLDVAIQKFVDSMGKKY